MFISRTLLLGHYTVESFHQMQCYQKSAVCHSRICKDNLKFEINSILSQ